MYFVLILTDKHKPGHLITRISLITVVIFCLFTVANAQFRKADSVRRVLFAYRSDDTTKVNLLINLAGRFEQINADTISRNASQAVQLAQHLKYQNGIAAGYDLMGVALAMRGNYDSAIELYKRSLEIAKAQKLYKIASSDYNHMGSVYFAMAKYVDAGVYYDSSIHAARAANDTLSEALGYGNIANIHYKVGNYSRALGFYLKSLNIQEALHQDNGIAANVSNIANVYYRIGQFDKAIEYVSRGLAINKKTGNTAHIIACYTTYALIYNDKKMYDSSLYYLQQGLELANKLQDPFTQSILKGNMAEAYYKKGDINRAFELYTETLAMAEKLGDAEGKAIAQAGIGEILLKRGDTKGISMLSEALNAMRQLGVKEQVIAISDKLEQYYEAKGDYKNALLFDKIKDSYSDSMKTAKTQQEAEQMMFGYELQKKEDKIQLLEKDNAIVQGQNQSQRILMFTLIGGLMLTIIIAYLFFRNVRNERTNSKLIEEQRQRLQELNDFKDKTFSVLSHDLRSPVNALTGTMMLLDEQVMSPEEFGAYKQELNNKLQTVSLLLDNLLQWAKSQMQGENAPQLERINMKRVSLKSVAVLKDAAAAKNINLTNTIDENLWAFADKNEADIVIRNLLSNAIKFTPEKGEISMSAKQHNDNIELSISDNGVGMTEEQVQQLFISKTNTSTAGTSGERGTGLGLRLCYDIIKRNAGDIRVSSIKGKGSMFTVVLPASVLT